MAGGNRYKHRSLGGGLVPNNQQAPSNNFYVAPPPEPSMLEKALQLAQALGDASSEFTGKANADPGNRLSPFGAAPTQFIKDSAKHLWDDRFGLVPAKKAFDAGSALADVLSGKGSTPFASVQGTQLAGDVANNATIAVMDASTLIPGMGVVPKGTYKAAGDLVGDASSAVAKGVRKLGYEPIPNQNALGVFGGPLAKTAGAARSKKDAQLIEVLAGQIVQRRRKNIEINRLTGTEPLQKIDYAQGRKMAEWLHDNPGKLREFNQQAPDLVAEFERISGVGVSSPKPLGYDDWAPEWKAAYDKGLPMDTASRMARAKEQGFTQPLYRGARGEDRRLTSGEGTPWFSDSSKVANEYADEERAGVIGKFLINPKGQTTIDAKGANYENIPFASLDKNLSAEILAGRPADSIKRMSRSKEFGAGTDTIASALENSGASGANFKNLRDDVLGQGEPQQIVAVFDPAQIRSTAAAFDPDNIGKPTMLGMGFPFSGKDGEKPLLSALKDALIGKKAPAPTPLDQFTPPTSIDDIFTGGSPRGAREITGGPTNPAGLDGSAFNLNTPEVPYDPAKGFGGLDAKFAADKNARTLSEALAKAKREGASDSDLLALLLSYGAASGMGASLWADQAQQQQPGM